MDFPDVSLYLCRLFQADDARKAGENDGSPNAYGSNDPGTFGHILRNSDRSRPDDCYFHNTAGKDQ